MSPSEKAQILQRAHYVEYKGIQQNWPLSSEHKSNIFSTKSGIPIFTGLPLKPYEVIGTVDISHEYVPRQAADAAKAVGADAVLACSTPAFTAANLEVGLAFRGKRETKLEELRGLLIRWK